VDILSGCRSRAEIYSGTEQRDQLQLYSHYGFRTQNVACRAAEVGTIANQRLACWEVMASAHWTRKMLTARKKGVIINKITPNMFITASYFAMR